MYTKHDVLGTQLSVSTFSEIVNYNILWGIRNFFFHHLVRRIVLCDVVRHILLCINETFQLRNPLNNNETAQLLYKRFRTKTFFNPDRLISVIATNTQLVQMWSDRLVIINKPNHHGSQLWALILSCRSQWFSSK